MEVGIFLLPSSIPPKLHVDSIAHTDLPMYSFWTGRYFDKEEGRQLRETRVLHVPAGLGSW